MLAGLTETLAGTLDIDEAMTRLGHAVTPHLADWSLITLSDATGAVRRVSAAHRDPDRLDEVHRFADLMITGLGPRSVVLGVQHSGRPIRRAGETPEKLLDRTTDDEMMRIAARLGYASFLIAPIMAPGGQSTLGSIALINGAQRPAFSEADERTAMDVGRRAGLAIDNSRLYRQQRHVAEVLQQSLLTDLPEIPGLELHARYLPAQDGAAVGGDWYDAFAQPDGSLMLAVGDVSGHDIEAAATMGQLRNLVRGDAFARDDEPGPLLSHLDRAVRGLGVQAAATAVLARVRQAGNGVTITFSNAGHPPPILLRPDGTVDIWWETPEPLLGLLPRARRSTHVRTVPAGSTLLLYTDGLIEDPAHLIDDGIARVTDVLRGNATVSPEDLATRLINAAPRRADDIALLLVRVS
jgi:GAF domain-containing protein